ncbi:GntR family transcriptional regulator [Actinomadura litoris]|uniref:GntR family transcriptional regulator n=1 Tax=Actinomadura litoris TaxID=2678616 RepID=A0A7K1LDS1_9ACTN|nr:GntR family transcriptional regulator [Actinomadura litoris]MUN42580.1 GntR family transcriptional regulator [Actinomadura litoris]
MGHREPANSRTGTTPLLWSTIRDQIIRDIVEGKIPPGSWLPTNAQIQERWEVSNRTSRRVLQELEQAGWAQGQGTRGYLATAGPAPQQIGQPALPAAFADATLPDTTRRDTAPGAPRPAHTIPINGQIPAEFARLRIISVGYEPAPAPVAYALNLTGPGAAVCVRRRLVVTPTTDATPLEVRISYTPGVHPDSPLAKPQLLPDTWPDNLATHTGHRPTTATSYISTRPAEDWEAVALHLPPATPALVRLTTLAASGTPIDQTVSIWPAATTTIQAEGHPIA